MTNQQQQQIQMQKMQQQQQQQQQQKQQPQQQQRQQQQYVTTQPAQQLKAEIKDENNTTLNTTNDSITGNDNENTKQKRPWLTGVHKLSKKERRERRNKRLGKIVRPKNAIMVLNELLGGNQSLKFEEIGFQNGMFGISVAFDGCTYEAYASSKIAAKQKACENALKGYISKAIRARQQQQANAAVDNGENNTSDDSMKMEDDNVADDVSWCHLASFALYKLMDSWQDVSDLLQPDALFQKSPNKSAGGGNSVSKTKELPPNAKDMHPVMLLYQMQPGIVIEDVSAAGKTPNIVYTVKVHINGEDIYGQGSNKKTARKNCAQIVMEKHFGVQYPPEPMNVA